jgi:hypothetical protein
LRPGHAQVAAFPVNDLHGHGFRFGRGSGHRGRGGDTPDR